MPAKSKKVIQAVSDEELIEVSKPEKKSLKEKKDKKAFEGSITHDVDGKKILTGSAKKILSMTVDNVEKSEKVACTPKVRKPNAYTEFVKTASQFPEVKALPSKSRFTKIAELYKAQKSS